jgi:hypothetical protein
MLNKAHQNGILSIHDLMGKTLFQSSERNIGGKTTLPVADLKPGYYFVVVNSGSVRCTRGFVKVAN